jgi:outer membrane receptor protein involved in Fe transport
MLWNASASAEVGLMGLPVLVGVEGRNLLNAPYRDAMSLMRFFADQPGRELWFRLSMRFDDIFSSHDHRTHETLR